MPSQQILNNILVLAERIPAWMEQANVPGLALTLIQDAEIAWNGAFGARDSASGEPVTPDTLFEAASLSKPVFAYAALKLCETGALDLDAPLADYVPDPYLPDEVRCELVTMRHVLSHTTGLPNWRPKGKPLRMHFAPGERFSYSGEGYGYLYAVVEHVIGQAPVDHVRANLLEPLGMEHSRFVWTGQEGLLIALPHDENGEPKKKGLWPNMNVAAGLHCTSADFGRFMAAVMRPRAGNPSHLGADMTRDMLTSQVQVNDSAPWHKDWPRPEIKLDDRVGWGLGWGLQRTTRGPSFWHWGDNGRYRAFAVGFPESGFGVVVMTNGEKGQQVISRILRQAIGGDYPGLDWIERAYAG